MSDARSCGKCIYFNDLIHDCGMEPQCMRDVDEAKYTAYIKGKKQGRADVLQEFKKKIEFVYGWLSDCKALNPEVEVVFDELINYTELLRK